MNIPNPSSPVDLSILNWPIETVEAVRLWDSEHKCNTMKAYAAFSISVANYNELLKRAGYTRIWRTKAIVQFSQHIREPGCNSIPFTEINEEGWWGSECLPFTSISNDYNLNDIIEAAGLLYDNKPIEFLGSFDPGFSLGFQ